MKLFTRLVAIIGLILLMNRLYAQQIRIISTGSAGNYLITYPGYFSLSAGQEFTFQANHTNTGTATLNVNSTGAAPISKQGSVNLAAGDIVSGMMVKVIYDGSRFQMLSATASSGTVTGWQLNGNTGTNPSTNYVGTNDNVDLVFRTGGTEKMRLGSSGFLGIGSSSPSELLHLENSAPRIRMKSTQTSGSFANAQLYFGHDDGSGGFVETGSIGHLGGGDFLTVASPQMMLFNTNFSTRMMIDNAGKVGINTGSPSEVLDVNGNLKLSYAFMPGNNAGNSGEVLISQGAGNPPLWTAAGTLSGGSINYIPKWATATSLSSTSLLYDNGTSLGVNTTTAGSMLSVAGNLSVGSGYAATVAPTNGMIVEGKVAIGSTGVANEDQVVIHRLNTVVGPGYSNLYVQRSGNSSVATSGNSWGPGGIDAGIKSYSYWGNNYSAAIAGYNYLTDFDNAVAVFGGDQGGSVFGALGYRGIGSSEIYAGYFNGKVKTTSSVDIGNALLISGNAGNPGEVLKSNGAGLAPSWGAAAAYTASNGLSMAGSTINLGGTLNQNTSINLSSFNLAFTGSGLLGIKTAAPAATLHVHETSGTSQFRVTNNVTGSTSTDGFSIASGGTNDVYLGQHENANMYLTTNSVINMTLKPNGNVGIQTTTAASALTVYGGVSIGTGYTGTAAPTDGLLVQGNTGFGASTSSLIGKVTIRGNNTAVNGTDGVFLDLINDAANTSGTLTGIRLGNYPSSPGAPYLASGIFHESTGETFGRGNLVFITGTTSTSASTSFKRMVIESNGNVGIGTTAAASSKLDVNGTITLSGGITSEIRRTNTGAANLIPIAYGYVSGAGAGGAGTGNFTVTKVATGIYDITITGFTYSFASFVTSASIATGTAGFIGTNSIGGNLRVYTYNITGAAADLAFYFIVFKP